MTQASTANDSIPQHLGFLSEKVYDIERKQENFESLQKSVERTEQNLKAFTLAHKRPGLVATEKPLACKAFHHYIKTGERPALDQKALHTSEDNNGGYLVPQQLSHDIATTLKEQSFFRALANVTSISADALETLVSHNDMEVGWAKETAEHPETQTPAFRKIRIRAHELYARPKATQKLIDDALVNIESWIVQQVTEQIAQKETEAFIQGDGDGKPRGFLTYVDGAHNGTDQIDAIKTGKNGAFADQNPAHALFDMVGALKSAYLSQSVWVMSRAAASAVQKLKEPNQMHYLWQTPQGKGQTATLLGHPVYVTDFMPTLQEGTAANAIAFGNFKQAYHIVDRKDVHILRDPYSAKPYVEFYTTKRVGGDVINPEALKVLSFSE